MIKAGFGTDGWRGVIADDFTVENLRIVVQAIMSYIKGHGKPGRLVIGHDTRFMSEYYARVAASVASGNGIDVSISEGAVTTPILSHAARAAGGCGGIMVTASHNPFYYNGIKYKGGYGGSAFPSIIKNIESHLGLDEVMSEPFDRAVGDGRAVLSDFFGPYAKDVCRVIDAGKALQGSPRVVVDCMHGSAGAHAASLFAGLGLDISVIRADRDPYFGGTNPEPTQKNMEPLRKAVIDGGYDIGFAVDGDADRLGVVDGKGRLVTAHRVLSLLVMHMRKNRKKTGAVVKTVSTSSIVDRVAARLGLPVIETPVGFKHICELMLAQDVMIGGEENGGVGIKGFIPERDGLMTALLVLEMLGCEGKGIGELSESLDTEYGRLYYKREDIPVKRGGTDVFREIKDGVERRFGEFGILQVKEQDGVKAVFSDGSWILFRLSGTEPLVRVYSESGDPAVVDRLMKRAGEAILG